MPCPDSVRLAPHRTTTTTASRAHHRRSLLMHAPPVITHPQALLFLLLRCPSSSCLISISQSRHGQSCCCFFGAWQSACLRLPLPARPLPATPLLLHPPPTRPPTYPSHDPPPPKGQRDSLTTSPPWLVGRDSQLLSHRGAGSWWAWRRGPRGHAQRRTWARTRPCRQPPPVKGSRESRGGR